MTATLTTRSKILTAERLVEKFQRARADGLAIVHCHGCFDIVHPGHVRHLEFAARQADILFVSVSDDSQINKGAGRPLIPASLRAENLAALNCVDWVHIDPHPTARELLDMVHPDIYLKGSEYESNTDPRFLAEKDAVETHGGRVVFSSGDVVFSSSALIAAMAHEHDPFGRQVSQLAELHDLDMSALESIINRMADRRVIVIGEPIIDTYVYCERPEVASEGPLMSLRPVESQSFDGGAAIVAQHAAMLGARVEFVTAMPENDTAGQFSRRLRGKGVNVQSIPCNEPIVEKERFLVGQQKVMKLDRGRPMVLDATSRAGFVDLAVQAVEADGGADAVILCDFGLGLLTPTVIDHLIARIRPRVPVLTGDVSGRRSNLLAMRDMDLLCPSEMELREAIGDFSEGLGAVVWRWFEQTSARAAMVTMAEDGVVTFRRGSGKNTGQAWHARLKSEPIPALGPIAIDQLGCGDALLATATLALACGADVVQAGVLGSLAAAMEGRQLGNIPIGAAGLRHECGRLTGHHLRIASAV